MGAHANISGAFSLLALASCGHSAVQVAPSVTDDSQRPNVLLIVSDDQSYPYAGAYGCPWVRTPGFDRIASEGILFNRCYTPNAKSAPSRACMLTGRYSWELGALANHIPIWPDDRYPTVFEVLAEAGYEVGFTGKGWAPGEPGSREGKPRRLTGRPWQKRLVQEPPTTELGKWDYAANFADFLEHAGSSGRPWLFWMGIREPHRKYQYGSGISVGGKSTADIDRVPSYWPDCDSVRVDMLDFAYEIEYYDDHVTRSLELLEQSGALDNTIVIITSDNGMPFPRRKGNSYEGSVHLPLAVMWPRGITSPGRVSDDYVSVVDFVPTILEAAGLDAGALGMESLSGVSMCSIMRGRSNGRDHLLLGRERHDAARPEDAGYPIRGMLRSGLLLLENARPDLWPAGNPEFGYRDADSSPTKSFILNEKRSGADSLYWEACFGMRPSVELYDLAADPDCMDNLADHPHMVRKCRRLQRLMHRELRRQGDPRELGGGDGFDRYPFYKPSLQRAYEQYLSDGTVDAVFSMSDYEKKACR